MLSSMHYLQTFWWWPFWAVWGTAVKIFITIVFNHGLVPIITSPIWGPFGLPHSSVGRKSACNAGDPSSIPGSGRSPGEGIGYLLQYSWASLVAQLVKNPPAMQETWVQSLGWEDSLEKGEATHSSILAWRIPGTIQSMGSQRVRHDWATFTFTFTCTF